MYPSVVGVSILKQIKFIYKVLMYCRLIPFQFDGNEKKFKCSSCRRRQTQIVFCLLVVLYALMVNFAVYQSLNIYISFLRGSIHPTYYTFMYVCLRLSRLIGRTLTSLLFVCNFLARGHCLLPIANEMIDIYRRLKPQHMDYWPCVDSSYLYLVTIKIYMMLWRAFLDHYELSEVKFIGIDTYFPYTYLVCVGMKMTLIYFQLVLLCFYTKMNEFLGQSCGWRDNREVLRCIRKFVAISNRIHRVKEQIDWFYTIIFFEFFTGMFGDIYYIYANILGAIPGFKGNIYADVISSVIALLLSLSTSLDVYLFCRMGDSLSEAEREFRRHVSELIDERGLQQHRRLQRTVDLMVQQHLLRPMDSLCFQKMRLNRKFAFSYFFGMVMANVITCLQLYASLTIPNHKKVVHV